MWAVLKTLVRTIRMSCWVVWSIVSTQVKVNRGLHLGCKGIVKKVSLRSKTGKWVVNRVMLISSVYALWTTKATRQVAELICVRICTILFGLLTYKMGELYGGWAGMRSWAQRNLSITGFSPKWCCYEIVNWGNFGRRKGLTGVLEPVGSCLFSVVKKCLRHGSLSYLRDNECLVARRNPRKFGPLYQITWERGLE